MAIIITTARLENAVKSTSLLCRLIGLLLCALNTTPAMALYDPPPLLEIAPARGCWAGTLTYDDYSQPGHLVTLSTRLFVAMSSPTTLTLQYDFDEGKRKHVYSYESMDFDLAKSEITWTSGATKRETTVSRIMSNDIVSGTRRIVFERKDKGVMDRYTLDLGATTMSMLKEEVSSSSAPHFRNRYEFKRE